MTDLKTVGDVSVTSTDPLYAKQKEDVSKMRASLLSCSGDSTTTKQALQNITTLRVYHQITRIIKYIEMCDKIEQKMYESIDCTLDTADSMKPQTWIMLLEMQERLQKIIIESHKVLQPYLNLTEFTVVDLNQSNTEISNSASILDAKTRDKLRVSAQAVLMQLDVEV